MSSSRFTSWINSPIGPKTTHFWGRNVHFSVQPFIFSFLFLAVANWSIALAGIADMGKSPDLVSYPMTGALSIYSILFMRFAWVVVPQNLLLLSCHIFNESVQLRQLYRKIKFDFYSTDEERAAVLSEYAEAALASQNAKQVNATSLPTDNKVLTPHEFQFDFLSSFHSVPSFKNSFQNNFFSEKCDLAIDISTPE